MQSGERSFRLEIETGHSDGPAEKQAEVSELAYIAVLVTMRMHGGLPFHVERARQLGATAEEIRGAMLVPLPVIGIQAAEALPYIGG
ncbi:MAG: carboxymuconolactone decarboxylase family protein [Clostridia bacterium]|nr:carboxymuconolactone decarboxylase family protein [Clostridia bacterium]